MIHKNRIVRELAVWLVATSTILSADSVNVYSYIPRQDANLKTASKSIDDLFALEFIPKKDSVLIEESNTQPRFISEHELDKYIDSAYRRFRVPKYITKDFIKKRIKLESSGNVNAISSRGAMGLSQLTLGAWNQVDSSDFNKYWSNPQKNLDVAVKYDLWLDRYFRKNNPNWNNLSDENKRGLNSAAYNGGLFRLEKGNWNIESMTTETTGYVDSLKINDYPDSVKTD